MDMQEDSLNERLGEVESIEMANIDTLHDTPRKPITSIFGYL